MRDLRHNCKRFRVFYQEVKFCKHVKSAVLHAKIGESFFVTIHECTNFVNASIAPEALCSKHKRVSIAHGDAHPLEPCWLVAEVRVSDIFLLDQSQHIIGRHDLIVLVMQDRIPRNFAIFVSHTRNNFLSRERHSN